VKLLSGHSGAHLGTSSVANPTTFEYNRKLFYSTLKNALAYYVFQSRIKYFCFQKYTRLPTALKKIYDTGVATRDRRIGSRLARSPEADTLV
jgi:hypothetical protein